MAFTELQMALPLVNCITREVLRTDGQPAFGGFAIAAAGVLGRGIHAAIGRRRANCPFDY
ncbi:MAG UNVERIFIED_CONTAM: hypothetical protein LVR18_27125 [Planctomycetaceae bacterium]